MEFTRDALANNGFVGFVTWTDLAWDDIPSQPGVYVVVRENPNPLEILNRNPAGRHKGRDPTVSRQTLKAAWIDGCPVLYIGKASRLRTRLQQYRDHGKGKPVGHWGGRYIWQLKDSSDLRIAWKVTPEDPRNIEQEMLAAFLECYGRLPFANLRR